VDDEDVRAEVLETGNVLLIQSRGSADDSKEDGVDVGPESEHERRDRVRLVLVFNLQTDLVLGEFEDFLQELFSLDLDTVGKPFLKIDVFLVSGEGSDVQGEMSVLRSKEFVQNLPVSSFPKISREQTHLNIHSDFHDSTEIVLILVVEVDQVLDQAFRVALMQLVEYQLTRGDISRRSRHVRSHQSRVDIIDRGGQGFLR